MDLKKQSTIQIAKLYVNIIVYDWNLLQQLRYILVNKIIKLDQTINIRIRSNIRKLPPQKKKNIRKLA